MNFNSKNPFLSDKRFSSNAVSKAEEVHHAQIIDYNQEMTLSGTINKTAILFLILCASSMITWWMAFNGMNPILPAIGGAIVGLILVVVSTFKPQASPYLAPGYALFEGLFIGGISAIFELRYPGIVINAVSATLVTFLVCLGLYKFKIVKVTEQFKSVVIAATLAIATYYLISWIASLIFNNFTPVHYGNGMMSIGISVFVIIIAALNLFLDFDQIEKGVQERMPKFMEWYGAMGLMITLVWLYIEFLRLLSKLASNK
ncbi:putative YccA/Bax inhibitor family protein [Flavobacterium sp. 90]|uniref:Bax inhibitor-1/YccA family protein n=1 Tax=unclassified Flavobacterium TaxID=196869 RepID=UPI000EAEE44A|nr:MULTISPECIES: Bax inhibitor-1/YccA family protein [unclassified Flavobacterium]RKR09995.1 putative YccA/Bax inhibitor family protein [Flavobacterium sp. 81]TCK53779.1 putative YccA/Bax inhibitor family protein [Flavobacterium sp. 90]